MCIRDRYQRRVHGDMRTDQIVIFFALYVAAVTAATNWKFWPYTDYSPRDEFIHVGTKSSDPNRPRVPTHDCWGKFRNLYTKIGAGGGESDMRRQLEESKELIQELVTCITNAKPYERKARCLSLIETFRHVVARAQQSKDFVEIRNRIWLAGTAVSELQRSCFQSFIYI
eukprot:TRINITY_DN3323_c0_g1_i10.p1 TRINITY_DN3323_c0_g1~~TRINITY_DN3323_c0_g1_i10.p1  ORF type:complete len:170 (+),score=43.32 TRINITY_DN3323_c0_g1_i10:121-630(+)